MKKEKKYTINMEAFTEQMSKEDVSNWLVREGVKMIVDGKKIGKNMIHFLQIRNIIDEA